MMFAQMNARRHPYPVAAIIIGVILIASPFVAELLGRSASERTTLVMMAIGGGALLTALTGFVADSIRASSGPFSLSLETNGKINVVPPPEAELVSKAVNGAKITGKNNVNAKWTFYKPSLAPAEFVWRFFDPEVTGEENLKPNNYSDVLYFATLVDGSEKRLYFAHRVRGLYKVIRRKERGSVKLVLEDWDIKGTVDEWLNAKEEPGAKSPPTTT